jgi:hypothetical protein
MKNEVAVFFMDLEPLNMKNDTFLRNVGGTSPSETDSHPRRPESFPVWLQLIALTSAFYIMYQFAVMGKGCV